jgi:hypothetical protein
MANGTTDNGEPFSLADWAVAEATAFVTPLLEATSSPAAIAALLANIGWQADALPALAQLVIQVSGAVDSALGDLYTAVSAADGGSGTQTGLELAQQLAGLVQPVSQAISGFSQAGTWQNPPAGLANLPTDMLLWLTDTYLLTTHPLLHGSLALLQLLTPQAAAPEQPAVYDSSGKLVRSAFRIPELHLDRMSALLKDPAGYLRAAYLSAGSLLTPADVAQFTDALFPVVASALKSFGLGAYYGLDPYFDQLDLDATSAQLLQRCLTLWILDSDDTDTDLLGATFALVGPDDSTGGQVGVVIAPTFPTGIEGTVGGWSFTVGLTAGGAPLSVIGWVPYPADPSSWPGLGLAITLQSGQPVGAASGSTPTASGAASAPGAQLTIEISVNGSAFDARLTLSLNGSLSLSAADFGDGFLQQILPADGIKIPLALTIQGSRDGWNLTGSAPTGSAIVLAEFSSRTVGPVMVDDLRFQISPDVSGLTVGGYLTAAVTLGPLTAAVRDLGLGLSMQWPAGGGNAGPLNLAPSVFWPTGAGLGIDAGVATGGGFVSFDEARGQYAGVLELALESLSLTAIGLIQTKMADGTPLPGGFSLLVVISVEFVPFIELGFGFSLNGVGGYFGLDRTINADALRAGVHSGSLDDIMFPVDPVGHAPQLIQELAGFFPAAPGRFLIGPMVQIQWGSPLPILTADLGVIIELPAPVRIAILGVLQVGLPQADEDAVILLNLDVLGLVDFGLGTLSLDASLYGSRIAEFPVTGDMALRLGWKAERDFIASFGGCHPAQQLPPNFPTLDRLAICLSNSDKLVFTLQAYLAATSNTLQFGASAHLLADVGDARVDGMVSFDALIHTNPFGIQVDFAAAVTVWFDGQQLLAVSISGQLTGPAPWQVSAQASISLFGISTTVPVQFSLGAAAALLIPAPIFVAGLLAGDVGKSVNWSALPPPGDTVVTLTPAPPSGTDMRAHPLGSLTFHQSTVPLGITIDKFGSADVSGPSKLGLISISYGNSPVDPAAVTTVQDAFAPGQFLALSDSDALSLPAFATYQAGVTFTPTTPDLDALATGDAAALSYTIDLIDSQGQPPASPPPPLDAQAASRVVPSGPAARAPTRTTGPRRYQGTPGTIAVNPRPPAGRLAP